MKAASALALLACLFLSGSAVAVAVDSAPSIDNRITTPIPAPGPVAVGQSAPPVQAAAPDRALPGNPLWAIPLRTLQATRERPLFAPTRRPPPVAVSAPRVAPPPPPPPKPAEPVAPPLALVGTVANGAEGIGIFFDEAEKSVIRLKTGDNHKGWVLRAVQRRGVVLMNGPQTAMLRLPDPNSASSPPPAAGGRQLFPQIPVAGRPPYPAGAAQTANRPGGPSPGAPPTTPPPMLIQLPTAATPATRVNPFAQNPFAPPPGMQLPAGQPLRR